MLIVLGSTVKDTITGFTGIAVSRTEYLTGCVRYGVQNIKLDKEGVPMDWLMFDEGSLIVIKVKSASKKKKKSSPGGNPNHNSQPNRKSISK